MGEGVEGVSLCRRGVCKIEAVVLLWGGFFF